MLTGLYRVTAVCSRESGKAEAFGKRHGAVRCFTDLYEFASWDEIDAVYIATPNSLHYEQCLAMLKVGKHVIVEKPAFSNIGEAEKAFALAEKNGVLLFEAMRSIHEENHRIVKDAISQIGTVCGANLTFMKRSPRYDLVLDGEEPGIFSLKYSGGALMDLGVYLVYDAVDWFGVPEDASYFCQKAHTGADTVGVAVLRYPGFEAVLNTGKTCGSQMPSEIRGRDKIILLDAAQSIKTVRLIDNEQNETVLSVPSNHWMEDQARVFAGLISGGKAAVSYQRLKQLALSVHELMTKLRMGAGIVFPADEA